jgi:hypothetical protein
LSIRPVPASASVDVAILADFRTGGETAWRLAQEIRIQAEAGYTTALVHMPPPSRDGGGAHPGAHPGIEACLREGLAMPLPAVGCWLRAGLLVIASPDCLSGMPEAVPHVATHRVAVVVDGEVPPPAELLARDRLCRALFGTAPEWTATTEQARRTLAATVATASSPWHPSVAVPPAGAGRDAAASPPRPARQRPARQRPVIGRTCTGERGGWPGAGELQALLPGDGRIVPRLLDVPGAATGQPSPPPGWQVFPGETSPERFVAGLDFLVHYPGAGEKGLPMTVIALALCRGVPVLLPPELEPVAGPGPLYVPAGEAAPTILRLNADEARYREAASAAREAGLRRFGPEVHLRRLASLSPAPLPAPLPAPAGSRPARPSSRRVLFVTSNGVGLGHVTRLLAVARRMPPDCEPVFATMSQALPVIEDFGFPVEHITSHLYTGVDSVQWNGWLRRQLDAMIDFHAAAAVVLDSTNPYDGVIRAVLPRRDCALVWMRRGLWRPTAVNRSFLDRSRYFDLIIEPEEIAEPGSQGDITALDRDGVLRVPPIRLLDPDELLTREEAAAALGLDPSRPAVLVQLGSGANRDVVRMTDRILSILARHEGLQVAVMEWLIASMPMRFWGDVVNLRGYPVSRYFRAFDFTVSAAGYNSFTEAMTLGLPAIFIANGHVSMDDQTARSRFAQENGAGFHLDERDLGPLDGMVKALLDPHTRDLFRFNALRLARENGAEAAAQAVAAGIG